MYAIYKQKKYDAELRLGKDVTLYRLDVTPEVVAEKWISIPSGKEAGANSLWIPGGETSGTVPEAVLNTVPLDKTRVSRIGIK